MNTVFMDKTSKGRLEWSKCPQISRPHLKALCGPRPRSSPWSKPPESTPSQGLGCSRNEAEPRSPAAPVGSVTQGNAGASEHSRSHLEVLVAQPHRHEVSVHWEELHGKLVLGHHGVQTVLQVPQVKLHRLAERLHGCQQRDRRWDQRGRGWSHSSRAHLWVTEPPPLCSAHPAQRPPPPQFCMSM